MSIYNLLNFVLKHPLNANGKLAALLRVFRWQVASRLFAGPIVIPFVGQTKLLATHGMTGATGNWYCGLHEINEMAFVLHFLNVNDHFVDVGANIGSYTILAAGAGGARVTAVEPIPETFYLLESNVLLNRLITQVRTCRMGLSNQRTTLRFTTGLDTVNHVLADSETLEGVEVPVMSLDELLGDDIPELIKIDVEGHERAVLMGAEKTLADTHLLAVIMETNGSGLRYAINDEELITIMQRNGFEMYTYNPFTRKLIDTKLSQGNTIFIRDKLTVQLRLDNAKYFKLVNGSI